MIKIDFSLAISIYISFIVLLVIGHWIIYTCSEERKIFDGIKFIEQCPYCTCIFFDYEESSIKICPQCKSYLSVEDKPSKLNV